MASNESKKNKRHVMQSYHIPRCDETGQWWWGYQKVRMIVLPEEEKQKFLKTFNFNRNSNE